MGKIKLSLVSGAVVEKPLISAFKKDENNYVILDNEMNGSMGLPIILVSKFINNKLSKIVDQNEWQNVKELLKSIIAGNRMEYISIPSEIAADDIYFTQLTLPVPSFDALKNAYVVSDENNGGVVNESVVSDATQPISTPSPIETPSSVAPKAPVMEPIAQPEPVAAVENNFSQNIQNELNTPVMPDIPTEPVQPDASTTPLVDINTPAVSETPSVMPMPNKEVNSSQVMASDDNQFAGEKEAFMKACENMFDALVKKFSNK